MLIPYKQWLLAKQRRRMQGSWGGDIHPSSGTDCGDLHDVVHSPQFKARFADLIGMGTQNSVVTPPIRCRAVSCDTSISDDNVGLTPKGEDK